MICQKASDPRYLYVDIKFQIFHTIIIVVKVENRPLSTP